MKKRLMSQHMSAPEMEYLSPLMQLGSLLTGWNHKISEVQAARHHMPEALSGMLENLGAHCGEMLAGVEEELARLEAMPGMRKLMASLVECKKMEIRRAANAITEMVEKHSQKRLHTQLFFAAHDGMAFGEGLDEYKDIMEELMRRLRLMVRMRTLEGPLMDRVVDELKRTHAMFEKKRLSILEKAEIPAEHMPHFAMLVDEALMMLKPKMNHHQISLATFRPERSVKQIADNMGEFFDEVHGHGHLSAAALPQTVLRRRRGTSASGMMPLPRGLGLERRASA